MSDKNAFMSEDERAEPWVFETVSGGRIRFYAARRDLIGDRVVVHAKGKTDEQLAAGVMEFSWWWTTEVKPRLNGFMGLDCITWEVRR